MVVGRSSKRSGKVEKDTGSRQSFRREGSQKQFALGPVLHHRNEGTGTRYQGPGTRWYQGVGCYLFNKYRYFCSRYRSYFCPMCVPVVQILLLVCPYAHNRDHPRKIKNAHQSGFRRFSFVVLSHSGVHHISCVQATCQLLKIPVVFVVKLKCSTSFPFLRSGHQNGSSG